MAIVTDDSTIPVFSFGDGVKAQLVKLHAVTGSTSGSVVATGLSKVLHAIFPPGFFHTAAPTFSNSTVTWAGTVKAETAATLVFVTSLTATAVAGLGAAGNNITIALTAGGTAGAEVVTVVGNAISVQIEDGVSTRTQVRTAMQASAACTALVTTTGTSASAASALSATPLAGGLNGGSYGYVLCLGV